MTTKPILMIQTADADVYSPMLRLSGSVNEPYCRRQGIDYKSYLGILRGYFPWQACFNRIIMLRDLIDAGFAGWVFYLDADAYVYDQSFDIRNYLNNVSESFIAAAGGLTGEWWDVNDGVFLLDLEAPLAREIVKLWVDNFLQTSDEQLRTAHEWQMVPSDQPRLHRILRDNPHLKLALRQEPRKFLNHHDASFVRQVLRSNADGFESRLLKMEKDIKSITQDGQPRERPGTYSFVVGGKEVSSSQYGGDYVAEFKRVLNTYVRRSKPRALEWGAGITSLILAEFCEENEGHLLTIDEQQDYLAAVVSQFRNKDLLEAKAISLTGPCVNDRDPQTNYSTYPLTKRERFDFIFIDGRRRIECGFVAALLSHDETVVVLHDYRRTRYQHITALFDILEDGSQFRVMRLRNELRGKFNHLMGGAAADRTG